MFKSDPAFPSAFAKALRYLVDNGTMSTRGIEKRFDLPGGCMDKWLDAHNRGSHFLELETIEAVEAGLPPPAPNPEEPTTRDPDDGLDIRIEPDPDAEPETDKEPQPLAETMKTPPYLKLARKPQQRTVAKLLGWLSDIANGTPDLPVLDDYADLVESWFGTTSPSSDVVRAFLDYVDLSPKAKKKTGGGFNAASDGRHRPRRPDLWWNVSSTPAARRRLARSAGDARGQDQGSRGPDRARVLI